MTAAATFLAVLHRSGDSKMGVSALERDAALTLETFAHPLIYFASNITLDETD